MRSGRTKLFRSGKQIPRPILPDMGSGNAAASDGESATNPDGFILAEGPYGSCHR